MGTVKLQFYQRLAKPKFFFETDGIKKKCNFEGIGLDRPIKTQ